MVSRRPVAVVGPAIRCVSSPTARSPERDRPVGRAADVDGLESVPEWVGDGGAAALFGSPELIRAALLPEHADEFDAAFDAALTAARRTLRLDQLRSTAQVWRRVAVLTRETRGAARQLVDTTVEVRRTSAPGLAACRGTSCGRSWFCSRRWPGRRRRSWRTPSTSILMRRSRSGRSRPRRLSRSARRSKS
ncbi:DUF6247 family protein [Saccharothrix sp. Mg75]|uniref:DUF6247 family protein n=1 Tax=Saccharothrix sp. Mg75 TaxID=3445357 RepID=UPI003EEC4E87